jgi:flagellar biosynthesis/type III secretory pathway protein FliH
MGGFQQQMEQMLSDAAEVAVRDRTASLLDGVRAELQEDVKRILAEATASQSSDWMDESLKRMNQVAEESARTRHAQWTKKVETELQQAIARMEARHRELEELSERLTKSAHERLESAFEVGRTEAVGRIVARLKEQSAPVIDNALKVVADLTKREEEMEKICQQFAEKSAVQIEETCTRLDKQFEMILRERLDSAREELDRAASAASSAMLHNLRASAQQYESEAQARLQVALAPATETALASLQEKAAEISRQFAGELSHYSRSHLEFVGGAISDLAKGIGKLSKD